MTETILVPERFCGPPGAANGGYLCGRLAALVGGTAEVTLRRPAPLGRDLAVERGADDRVVLRHGEEILVEASAVELELDVPPPVSLAEARFATRRFPRVVDHPVPRCFVCGIHRAERDGLRIFPGPVDGRDLVAAPWTPDDSLAEVGEEVPAEFLWAALDCAGAFAVNEPPAGLALLGRLAATVLSPVRGGEPCIVLGWPIAREGRKLVAGTAVYSADGRLRAAARATWVLLRPRA